MYKNAITEAQSCVTLFKEWKKEYKEHNWDSQSKRLVDYLAQDKNIPKNIYTKLVILKPLVYLFRKPDSDLNKVNPTILLEYKRYDVHTPCNNMKLHAEMKIIDFIFNSIYPNKELFEYKIGISKLACAMCSIVIEEYNNYYKDTAKIIIRGSHGKVYTNWDFVPSATEENIKIYNSSLTAIAKKYQIGWLLKYPQKSEIASTNTSMSEYSDSQNSTSYDTEPLNKEARIQQMIDVLKDLINLDKQYKDIMLFNKTLYVKIENTLYYPQQLAELEQTEVDDTLVKLLGEHQKINEENWD
ncbi:MAG: nucleic acid/nucleotide deaminase domain-containing protein [Candidatus Tisiphia sp.]